MIERNVGAVCVGWHYAGGDDEPMSAPCAWCGAEKLRHSEDQPLCRQCVSVEVAERRRAEATAKAELQAQRETRKWHHAPGNSNESREG